MKDLTQTFIKELKSLKHPTPKDCLIDFYSEVTGSPISEYDNKTINDIANNILRDYAATADINPLSELTTNIQNELNTYTQNNKNFVITNDTFRTMYTNAILKTLMHVQVRNEQGELINGFTD